MTLPSPFRKPRFLAESAPRFTSVSFSTSSFQSFSARFKRPFLFIPFQINSLRALFRNGGNLTVFFSYACALFPCSRRVVPFSGFKIPHVFRLVASSDEKSAGQAPPLQQRWPGRRYKPRETGRRARRLQGRRGWPLLQGRKSRVCYNLWFKFTWEMEQICRRRLCGCMRGR